MFSRGTRWAKIRQSERSEGEGQEKGTGWLQHYITTFIAVAFLPLRWHFQLRSKVSGVRNNVSLPRLNHYNAWKAVIMSGALARQKHRGPNNSRRSPWCSCLPETALETRRKWLNYYQAHGAEVRGGKKGGSGGGTQGKSKRKIRMWCFQKAAVFNCAHAAPHPPLGRICTPDYWVVFKSGLWMPHDYSLFLNLNWSETLQN